MTQTRRTSSIHPRKKPLPSEVRSSLGSYLDKAKKRETFYGMMFTIGEMLGSLPWPGIKTAFHQTGSGPQVHITFPFAILPISHNEESRETVYKRTAGNVRHLVVRGVPENELWKKIR